ncbi:MAG: alanine--tRNA ligase [Planctomycetes bacterium]|nr:alanine--tRNA ligase [Planctomycetota bacterium]
MNTPEIRQSFLSYFESKGHNVLPSSPVIPHGDRTLLFTNAGMNQFKNVFTGKEKAPARRAATVQKCIRAGGKHNDLDNVGYTARHLTFFEMLGNFSFGDYFKEEAIEFAWELLTARLKLDPKRLWVTVYQDDQEARQLWQAKAGVPAQRIVGLGEEDNYWSMGEVGPCGPCSEVLIDRGEKYSCGPRCGIGQCDCDRFFEIWNLVFMQFDQAEGGKKTPLARPSIDTGMGLERIAMVLQGADSVFETDVLGAIIARLEKLTGKRYESGPAGTPHRVIADHIRSLVFAFADGAEPSNEGRGYVLRRILRRAARYGRKIQTGGELLLCRLVETVIETMAGAYPEIAERRKYLEGVIRSEEERFDRTLDQGIQLFEEMAARLRKSGEKTVPGKEVFVLYDTFGFPVDLVQQMAGEIGMRVDLEGYEREMEAQKARSRKESRFGVLVKGEASEALDLERFPETEFVGYRRSICEGELLGAQQRGEDWRLVLSQTPFYAESGGQVGDTGRMEGDDFVLEVLDTRKDRGRWIHYGRLLEGNPDRVQPGSVLTARIDAERRAAIERNHTATHLLHAALRQTLGQHVHQKGSLVEPARLRFDLTHFSGINLDERQQVEELVQTLISRNLPVETFETDYQDAVRQGAMALFGEKYGDRVRVVRIGDFSLELCGGTHVQHTGDLGAFALVKEGSVSAGVRRVEALTDREAATFHRRNARLVEELAAQLRVPPEQILERLGKDLEELKKLRSREGKKPAGPARKDSPAALGLRSEKIGAGERAIDLHYGILEGGGLDAALAAYDGLKHSTRRGIFIFLARQEGKVQVLVAVSRDLTAAGWDCRHIFQAGLAPIEGRGGGNSEMVRAGGAKPQGAEEALEAMVASVRGKAPA